jgi:dienelactone hydrolase
MTLRPALARTITAACALFVSAAAYGPAAALHAQTPVSFSTADGGVVSAELSGRGPRGVVLVHGGRFDAGSWRPQARVLADAGFRVLAIDLRGGGGSGGGRAGADSLHLDVLAAVRYLRETGAERVAVVGASIGGWAAGEALAVAPPGEIDRVVFLAHSSVDAPERLTGRKLFIVSRDDTRGTGVRRLDAIRDQYERAPGPKELVLLEGSAHAQRLFDTDQGEHLLREILRFLSDP